MKIQIKETDLLDLKVVETEYLDDERGFFTEPWNKRDFKDVGLDLDFKQEGHSGSKRSVLRGLHYQDMTAPMAKLVRCVIGSVFDVSVDLRVGSPTFGKWYGVELSSANRKELYVPVGFAHGFEVISEHAEIIYKMTEFYTPSSEGSIIWNDPDLKINWPIDNPILSEKDKTPSSFAQYIGNPAFKYSGH